MPVRAFHVLADKVDQIRHGVKHDIGGQGRNALAVPRRTGMRPAGEDKHRHPCTLRGLNPRRAVLDHDAVRRIGLHGACRVKEKIGSRLAVLDHAGTENAWLEALQQTGQRERQADALQLTGGCDASGAVERIQHFCDSRHRLQAQAKPIIEFMAEIFEKGGVDAVVEVVVQDLGKGG